MRSYLVARMGKMRGLPQKLGKMLSFSHNHAESAMDQYAALQQDAEPQALETARPVIEAAWGCPLGDVLASIDPALGQVHRATMLDGRIVAIKVQYPGIRDSIPADLKMLGWLSTPLGNLRQGFDLAAYRETILEDLNREFDYEYEANQQRGFAAWAAVDQSLVVPDVVDELSTKNILVSDWQQGDHWADVCSNWTDAQKRSLSNVMLRFFLTGIFQQRRMQADWHPGNFRFCAHGDKARLLLYDFGCVFKPSETEQLGLARLIQAAMDHSESPWPLFLKLGFEREFLEPLASKLPALCRVLFEPFCCGYLYDVKDWNLAERVTDLLGEDRWNFRIAGPARLIFLLRAFHGLSYYLTGLAIPIFGEHVFAASISSISADMNNLQILPEKVLDCGFDRLARYLKIRVVEDGRTKVQLTQYASSIEHLDELLDEDVKRRIDHQQICLKQIVSEVRARGCTPASLFCLTEGARQIDAWLE
jgi:predicted unusual protein kinase regulating ubiquinone biosynthesis (AarF/ABC1/UbiB family)